MLVRLVLHKDNLLKIVSVTHIAGTWFYKLHVNNKQVFKFAYMAVDVKWF